MSGDGAAAGAQAYALLAGRMSRCTACPLAAGRDRVVVGSGPVPARLLLLGEGPGAQEDATGVPFVGRAGQLLDQLLAASGAPRDTVAVTNVVKCRPPNNRAPTRIEIGTCRHWLTAQLDLLDPQVIVSLGGTATAAALGRAGPLRRVRGRAHGVGGRWVVPTYHPSAALRFGPQGAPRAALAADLAFAVGLLR